jgi:hypothetical protein
MDTMEGKEHLRTPELPWSVDAERYGQCLTALLGHLQGLSGDALVGAGLARFSAQRLAAIRQAAELKVDVHLHGMLALLQMITLGTRELYDRLPAHVIPDITAHLELQTQELACWRDLASQASYIREHPDFAHQLAQHYVQQAQAAGEWPNGYPGNNNLVKNCGPGEI